MIKNYKGDYYKFQCTGRSKYKLQDINNYFDVSVYAFNKNILLCINTYVQKYSDILILNE